MHITRMHITHMHLHMHVHMHVHLHAPAPACICACIHPPRGRRTAMNSSQRCAKGSSAAQRGSSHTHAHIHIHLHALAHPHAYAPPLRLVSRTEKLVVALEAATAQTGTPPAVAVAAGAAGMEPLLHEGHMVVQLAASIAEELKQERDARLCTICMCLLTD